MERLKRYIVEVLNVETGDFEALGVCTFAEANRLLKGRAGRLSSERGAEIIFQEFSNK